MPLKVCVLASGSTGNATLISDGQTHILIDSGLVAKETIARLAACGIAPHELAGIFITHAHIDHFRSAGTFFADHDVPVFADPYADRAIRQRSANASYNRVKRSLPIPETLGQLKITPFATSHHVWGGRPMGFVVEHAHRRVAVCTDTGTLDRSAVDTLRSCHAFVMETNYDAATLDAKLTDRRFAVDWEYLRWVKSDEGHLSNAQAAELLVELCTDDTQHVFLAHISENHSDMRRDNNSFELALHTVRERFARENRRLPQLHRTYRRDATEGQSSEVIVLD